MDDEFPNTLEESVFALEAQLSLSPGFLQGLLQEDDWSFILKVHALAEAAISHLLVKVTEREELRQVFSRLELSNPSTGKIAFIAAMDLLGKEERRLVRRFSELRNFVVHDVTKVDFNLKAYVSSLDSNQFNGFVQTYGYFSGYEDLEHQGEQLALQDFIRAQPKFSVWSSIMLLMGKIYLEANVPDIEALKEYLRTHAENDSQTG